ncbi:MAG: HAD family hydrolase [Geminicoccaceae bacterium]
MPQPPTTVIFDLGGVLIDWNPRYLYRSLFDDEAAMERFLAEICSPDWNLSLDAGRGFAEAVAELCARHPHERARIEAYQARWLEMIAGPMPDTVALLEELHARGVPLWALTNWSAETFRLVRHEPAYGFLDRFRRIFVSAELRMIKPDPAIFRHTLEEIGVPAETCLFIDDSARNIAAAQALGLHGHRFTDASALRAELARHGLLAQA